MINFYNQQNRSTNGSGVGTADVSKNKDEETLKTDINKYQAQNGVSSHNLKFGIWFTTYKVLLYRLALILFIVFDASVIIFSLWKIGGFLIYDFTKKDQMERELAYFANNSVILERYTPENLQIMDVKVYSSSDDKVDVLAKINNPNKQIISSFDYYFSFSNGQNTPIQRGSVLPGSEGVVVSLGLDAEMFQGAATLNIGNFAWRRVPAHDVGDAEVWQKDRINFTASDFSYTYAGQESGADANIIKFNLTNNSAFSYKEPNFVVELRYSGVSVGVMTFNVSRFMSLEVREIDLRNFVDNLQVNEIVLYPQVDVYDEGAFISPRS